MGFFSWRKQDTGKALYNKYVGNDNETVATLSDDKGNKWTTEQYSGYGTFNGVDYYDVLADMNPELSKEIAKEFNITEKRLIGIKIECGGDYPDAKYPNINEDPDIDYIEGTRPENANGQGHWEEDYDLD